MHTYIRDAERMIKKNPPNRLRLRRMHFDGSKLVLVPITKGRKGVGPNALRRPPIWYTRAQKGVGLNALRCLMLRAGIRRRTKTCYIMARAMLMEFLSNTIEASVTLVEHCNRKTMMLRDVKEALELRYGMRIYS